MLKGEVLDDLEEQLSDTECKGATQNVSVHNSGPADPQERSEEEDDEEEDTTASFEDCTSEAEWQTCSEASGDEEEKGKRVESSFYNSSRLLRKDELIEMFKSAHSGPRCKTGQLTVGLVSVKLRVDLHTHSPFIYFISLT